MVCHTQLETMTQMGIVFAAPQPLHEDKKITSEYFIVTAAKRTCHMNIPLAL